jgi:hypothetical protein
LYGSRRIAFCEPIECLVIKLFGGGKVRGHGSSSMITPVTMNP